MRGDSGAHIHRTPPPPIKNAPRTGYVRGADIVRPKRVDNPYLAGLIASAGQVSAQAPQSWHLSASIV